MVSIRSLLRGDRDNPGHGVVQHTVGNALVLHADEAISAEAQSLALTVVEDTENDVVVLDLGEGLPITSWESMAGVLPRRRRGIRLMACGEQRNAAAMAGQWFAERLGRTVIAPDGNLIRGAAGGLFVHSGPGSGWVRFRPGKPPAWHAKRYPTPLWDQAVTERRASSSTGEIEPLPGGVWIHDVREPEVVAGHRERLVADVPCQPEVMTVLLGCPGTPALSLDDVVRFWRDLDEDSRGRARFVQYGDIRLPEGEAFGQALADLLATPVICYTGVPIGSPGKFEIRTVREDGVLGWPPFALELSYQPRAHPNSKGRRPVILNHRGPLQWVEQVENRIYWYAPDAVIEVVQAGLWVRPAEEPANAERVRATRLDPEGSTLIFDDSVAERSGRMRELAEDLAARVDPALGEESALFPASVLVPGQKPAGRADAVLSASLPVASEPGVSRSVASEAGVSRSVASEPGVSPSSAYESSVSVPWVYESTVSEPGASESTVSERGAYERGAYESTVSGPLASDRVAAVEALAVPPALPTATEVPALPTATEVPALPVGVPVTPVAPVDLTPPVPAAPPASPVSTAGVSLTSGVSSPAGVSLTSGVSSTARVSSGPGVSSTARVSSEPGVSSASGVSSTGSVSAVPGMSSPTGVSITPGVSSLASVSSEHGVSSTGGASAASGVAFTEGVSSEPGVSSTGGASAASGVASTESVSPELGVSSTAGVSSEPGVSSGPAMPPPTVAPPPPVAPAAVAPAESIAITIPEPVIPTIEAPPVPAPSAGTGRSAVVAGRSAAAAGGSAGAAPGGTAGGTSGGSAGVAPGGSPGAAAGGSASVAPGAAAGGSPGVAAGGSASGASGAAPSGTAGGKSGATARTSATADEPVAAAEQVRRQPVPAASASAILPKRRPLDEERAWLRRTLSREFDTMASSVSRIMSEHPGLQGSGSASADDILADSVAVRLYLSRRGAGIDAGLRSGEAGPHVPLARCAVAGLSRLPSFRGTTVYRATPARGEWERYRERKLVTDWSFVNTLTGPCDSQEGDTDVLVWSMTARRTALLEPEGDERVEDRVLFLPGTHFKVLELREPSADGRGAVLMREIGANEIDEDGRVDPERVSLDELAVTSLHRSIERWATAEPKRRVGSAAGERFGLLPGLTRAGGIGS
ncbi:hypothetical protein Abr02nite_37870 [Paractinoplanes brasiliensis]|nr:hypothetical protein Abr02nite_37870 [Actinoplanes brasiliensis]